MATTTEREVALRRLLEQLRRLEKKTASLRAQIDAFNKRGA